MLSGSSAVGKTGMRYAGRVPAIDPSLRAPVAPVLTRLTAAVAPGSRVARVWRLHGGIEGITHAVDLVRPGGDRVRLVVRRYRAAAMARWPQAPLRLWRTLVALEQLGLPAPRPVLFDGDGAIFGGPALVMTRLPGRGNLQPRDLVDWCRQLGEALAAIHRVPIETVDLGFLPGPDRGRGLTLLQRFDEHMQRCALGPRIRPALERAVPGMALPAPVLAHGDYWAGNTLWRRSRLSGVVDWEDANVDYPGLDVGYCRMDLSMMVGRPAPDLFLRGYEQAMGSSVAHLPVWELLGVLRVPNDPGIWLPGLHGLGRTDLTVEMMRARLRAFTDDALARVGTA